MHRGLLIATVSTFVVVMSETAAATPFSDASENLPSSLAVASQAPATASEKISRDDIRPVSQPAGLKSPGDREIFPVSVEAPHSFIRAALESSLELPRDGMAPSIPSLITLASLTRADFHHPKRVLNPYGPVSNRPRTNGVTVRDLMKSMVHRTGQSDLAETEPRSGRKITLGNFLLTSVLETQLDMEFVDIVAGAVNPSINLEGLITLDILGLREIAVFMSRRTNEIQVLDFRTQRIVSAGAPPIHTPSLQPNPANQGDPLGTASREAGENYALTRWINAAKKFIIDFLRHPLTLLTVLVLSMLMMVRRIAERT